MPRVAISETTLNTRSGTAFGNGSGETTGDPVNGHQFVYSPRKVLAVRNTSGSTAYNITFTPASVNLDVFTAPTKVVSVPASAQRVFGPFPGAYAHPEDGDLVYVDVGNAALALKIFTIAEG
jgi:hypothetical protein